MQSMNIISQLIKKTWDHSIPWDYCMHSVPHDSVFPHTWDFPGYNESKKNQYLAAYSAGTMDQTQVLRIS